MSTNMIYNNNNWWYIFFIDKNIGTWIIRTLMAESPQDWGSTPSASAHF